MVMGLGIGGACQSSGLCTIINEQCILLPFLICLNPDVCFAACTTTTLNGEESVYSSLRQTFFITPCVVCLCRALLKKLFLFDIILLHIIVKRSSLSPTFS